MLGEVGGISLLEHASHPVGIGGGGVVEALVLGGGCDVAVEAVGVMEMEGAVGVAPRQIPFRQHVISTT